MSIQVGDRVTFVGPVAFRWSLKWGAPGDTGTVLSLSCDDTVLVEVDGKGQWFWRNREIDSPHTPDDLAMALELAELLEEAEAIEVEGDFYGGVNYSPESAWLRAEVIAALRGER